MALAISFDEAKKNRRHQAGDPTRGTSGGITNTPFFNFRDDPDLPHATLSERDPGRLSRTHFHLRDQFQVVVAGRGSLGRHELKPYGVHFSRAYTPYGPLLADAVNPMAFFVMRAHRDPGSQRLPQELEKLKNAVRRPWQITRTVSFESLHSAAATRDVVQEPIPGIVDERGLAAYTLTLRPHAQTMGPDASSGDGQYMVVVRGSVLYGGNEHKALALVFVQPQESALRIHAGPEGLDAIVLNFPRVEAPPLEKPAALPATQSSSRRFQCDMCAFAYDEAAGLPADGIAPGTRWEDVPESWNCPDCGASKSDFRAMS